MSNKANSSKKHISEGHRQRLRGRFLQSGLGGFLDYEIVELLLTLGTPRKDCKQMAKAAIKEFKGLRGVLDASLENLQKIKGIGPSNAFGIKLFQAVAERCAKENIPRKISLTNPHEVADYLRERLGRERKEHFVSILLDSRNRLISIHDISIGTLTEALVHPREVFEPAVRNAASSLLIAHNHPSNNTTPSPEDVALTRRLIDASQIMGIKILDHIIVTRSGYSSLRELNLI